MSNTPPDVTNPSITLTTPTNKEQQSIWSATHPSWGPGLTRQQYLDREAYLLTAPLARNGGLTQWMLTDSTASSSSERPILSSCETIQKRAIISSPSGTITDVTAHGVASVFTNPDRRGRGYASKMMKLLGEHLANQQATSENSAALSILFSDIGEKFYARDGWMPIGNTHIEFPVVSSSDTMPADTTASNQITELRDADLAELSKRDEQLLRTRLSTPLPPNTANSTRIAILPDHDTLQWHYSREDFMMQHFLSSPVRVRGAMYTAPASSGRPRRVWALWVRNRYGGAEGHAVYTVLHFLRFVVEDEEATTDDELEAALRGIMGVAQREAQAAQCSNIDIWNPSGRVRAVFEQRLPELQGKFVTRDMYNLASLRWFGPGSAEDLDWVANEKFAWC